MRLLPTALLILLLCACSGYELKNLAKSDTDMVTDQFIDKTRSDILDLLVLFYERNPDQLRKIPGMTVEGRLAQLRVHRYKLQFAELDYKQDIDALNLAFDPNFKGDRVFALIVGLGSMVREAYQYQPEVFLSDDLDAKVLLTSAYNVQELLRKLKTTRKPNGEHLIITYEQHGVVDNMEFERLFSEIIVLQEMMADIVGDADNRTVTGTVRAVSSVFIPLPI
jgi:hypothetical protein